MKITVLILSIVTILIGQNLDFLYEGIEGSLLISSLDGSKEFHVNKELLDSGYIPASTFKIPNTLIALETRIIDSSTIFEWDSITRSYKLWNEDQNLTNAFNRSCVWCYQQIAEQLSDSIYIQFLKSFEYGNKQTGDSITTFWLDGDIRISVNEQVSFLKRLYNNDLLIKPQNISRLKEIMINESNDRYILRGKTGWAGEVGWFVGYLEVNNSVWFFANQIKITDNSLLPLRKSLVLDSFKKLTILE
jgi:beta-lactamase class D